MRLILALLFALLAIHLLHAEPLPAPRFDRVPTPKFSRVVTCLDGACAPSVPAPFPYSVPVQGGVPFSPSPTMPTPGYSPLPTTSVPFPTAIPTFTVPTVTYTPAPIQRTFAGFTTSGGCSGGRCRRR